MGQNETLTSADKLFGFAGRIGRLSLVGYSLLAGICFVATFMAIIEFAVRDLASFEAVSRYALYVPTVLLAWPSLALAVKRLHDLNLSGWHAVWVCTLFYTPYDLLGPIYGTIGAIAALITGLWLILAPGTSGPNHHGLKPGMKVLRKPGSEQQAV